MKKQEFIDWLIKNIENIKVATKSYKGYTWQYISNGKVEFDYNEYENGKSYSLGAQCGTSGFSCPYMSFKDYKKQLQRFGKAIKWKERHYEQLSLFD